MISIKSISRFTRTLFGATAVVAALGMSQQAVAGIADTKHNLGSSANGGTGSAARVNSTTGTAEICVFCHTPHASNTLATGAPLWNKAVPLANTFTTYGTANSSTIDGKVLDVGSVSLACLSCHDGAQAMDNMVNAPGSGGYNAAGASAAYTWTGANQTAGALKAGIVSNLGKDLSNDHPIGIQYCGGGITGTATTGCKDPDFQGGTTGTNLKTASINQVQVWWVDTSVGTSGSRDKTDMILYNREFTAGVPGPSVECGTCHDPHSSTNATFLRVSNDASAVCLACHVK